jgi:hypothetical protein
MLIKKNLFLISLFDLKRSPSWAIVVQPLVACLLQLNV